MDIVHSITKPYFSNPLKTAIHTRSMLIWILLLACAVFLGAIVSAMYRSPVYIWDEAVYVNHALEMAANGKWLIYTRDGMADHYNTKPPLAIWLQAISVRVFGYYEFALRLPTLSALLGLLLLTVHLCRTQGMPLLSGRIVCLILLTTPGLIRPHVFLTADLDGILVFFSTALCFHVLSLTRDKPLNTQWLAIGFLLLFCAFMTKSVAIFLMAPSLLLVLWRNGKLWPMLRMRSFYFGLFAFLLLIAVYYAVREAVDPGYCAVVWESEITRYTSRVMSWHDQPFTFYMDQILHRFNPYYTVLTELIGIAWFFRFPSSRYRGLVIHCFLMVCLYLLVISIPSVKLEWYDAPLYPVWGLALGIMCFELLDGLLDRSVSVSSQLLTTGALLLIFIWPCYSLFSNQFLAKRILLPQEKDAACLKEVDRKFQFNHYKVLMEVEDNKLQHYDVLNAYIKLFAKRNKQVDLIRSVSAAGSGDTLLLTQRSLYDSLYTKFSLRKLNQEGTLVMLSHRQ